MELRGVGSAVEAGGTTSAPNHYLTNRTRVWRSECCEDLESQAKAKQCKRKKEKKKTASPLCLFLHYWSQQYPEANEKAAFDHQGQKGELWKMRKVQMRTKRKQTLGKKGSTLSDDCLCVQEKVCELL